MSEEIGFVGLGRMGSRMAARLLSAGHSLTVFDIDDAAVAALAKRGAKAARSPKEVADTAELVFASLPSPAIVQEIALGGRGLVNGSRIRTFVDLSTSGPRVAAAVAGALSPKGIAALDAPVSGGLKGAEQGTLTVMVSGPRAAYDRIEGVLSQFGKLFFMGEKPGLGQTMKLVNNLLGACAIAITGEGMAMGVKAGLDSALMVDVLNVSSGRSSATQDKWPRSVLPRSFDFGFATGLAFKDVRLCVEEAEGLGIPMVVGSAVRQVLSIANNVYGADSDFTIMAKLVEEWAGLDLPGPEPKHK
ncbi:MAG TPA: NAD(P)-dependent oxidoreductase [Rhizomicrobium sp.]|nr:NAD(P)-dependent oxidoreductase [Rhizomicrobium sp.]